MLVAQTEREGRYQLLERFSEARVRTDEIFDMVRPDSLYERPIPERHRIIFYLGHLEAFDWNLLRERVLSLKAFDSDSDKLFAFGIDPVNGTLPSDQPRDWPSAADARRYVKRIRESIDTGLEALDPLIGIPIRPARILPPIHCLTLPSSTGSCTRKPWLTCCTSSRLIERFEYNASLN